MSKKRNRTELSIEEEIEFYNNMSEDNKYRCEFAARVNQLMEEKDITPKMLNTDWGIKMNTLTNYRRGRVEPQLTVLAKLAKAFNVSIDYLCGLSEYKSLNIEDRDISAKTGLSSEAINVLKEYNLTDHNLSRTINFLLEQETLSIIENQITYIKDTSSSKYIKLKRLLDKRKYTPIISAINEYFFIKLGKNKEIFINNSPIIIDKNGKTISIDDTISTTKSLITRKIVPSEMIINNAYLDEIKDKLKQAKPKYISQIPSEVDTQ